MTDASKRDLMIKGAVIKEPRDWTRKAYGPEAYQQALESLSAEERTLIDGLLLQSSWYPIAAWDNFMRAMRLQAKERAGHSEHDFNMRNMREAGSAVVRTIYKFVLGLVKATTVIERGVLIFSRAYNQGRFEVAENTPGRAVVRFTEGSMGFRENLTHMLPTGLVFLLELNGTKDPRAEITADREVDGKLVFEVTVTYV